MDVFINDKDPQAYEKLVDRLLASEHFGERMAIYWLDLVRYADTVGYHGDQDHHASPYRDYVIDAFNRNIPFDQFTREQLAGDLLPDSGVDQKIASCYNRLLQTSHEGGVQPKEYLAIYHADRVRNLSAVWMGATVGLRPVPQPQVRPVHAEGLHRAGGVLRRRGRGEPPPRRRQGHDPHPAGAGNPGLHPPGARATGRVGQADRPVGESRRGGRRNSRG